MEPYRGLKEGMAFAALAWLKCSDIIPVEQHPTQLELLHLNY